MDFIKLKKLFRLKVSFPLFIELNLFTTGYTPENSIVTFTKK